MITNFKIFEGSVKKSDRIDIFRDDKYIVVAPLTEEASMKYGADSHWCTSASGSGAWCDESRPNNENSTVGLIILIRRNYKMTPRNEENSELYYYLFRKEENGETTKRERNKLELLREDDDYLNMSKLSITFSINGNNSEVWAANNIHLDWIYSLYDLVSYGIDDYVIDEVNEYISKVRSTKKFTLDKIVSVSEGRKFSGIPLKKMSRETFEWWVGSENVINGKIKVFRGTNIKNAGLRTGDFVTTNKIYAGKYGPFVEEFDIPVKYLNYFSGVKGGDPEQLHAWNLGKKAQPTELIYTGELISENNTKFDNNIINIPDDVAVWFMDFYAQQTIHFDVDIKSIPNILFDKTKELVKKVTGKSLVYRGETRDWEIKKPIRFSPLNDAGISWTYDKSIAMWFIEPDLEETFSYVYTLDLNDIKYPISMDLVMRCITAEQQKLVTNPITKGRISNYSSEKEILIFDTFYSDILKIERVYD